MPGVSAPKMPEMSGPKMPGMPGVDSDFNAPKLPDASLPGVSAPDVNMPGFKKPDLPTAGMPGADVKLPEASVPDVDLSAPKLDADVSAPDVDKPKMALDNLPVVGAAVGAVGAGAAGVAASAKKPSGFGRLFGRNKKPEGVFSSVVFLSSNTFIAVASHSCRYSLLCDPVCEGRVFQYDSESHLLAVDAICFSHRLSTEAQHWYLLKCDLVCGCTVKLFVALQEIYPVESACPQLICPIPIYLLARHPAWTPPAWMSSHPWSTQKAQRCLLQGQPSWVLMHLTLESLRPPKRQRCQVARPRCPSPSSLVHLSQMPLCPELMPLKFLILEVRPFSLSIALFGRFPLLSDLGCRVSITNADTV